VSRSNIESPNITAYSCYCSNLKEKLHSYVKTKLKLYFGCSHSDYLLFSDVGIKSTPN